MIKEGGVKVTQKGSSLKLQNVLTDLREEGQKIMMTSTHAMTGSGAHVDAQRLKRKNAASKNSENIYPGQSLSDKLELTFIKNELELDIDMTPIPKAIPPLIPTYDNSNQTPVDDQNKATGSVVLLDVPIEPPIETVVQTEINTEINMDIDEESTIPQSPTSPQIEMPTTNFLQDLQDEIEAEHEETLTEDPYAQELINEDVVLHTDPNTIDNYDAYEKSKQVYSKDLMKFEYDTIVEVINKFLLQFSKSIRSRFIPSEEQLRVLYNFSKRLLIESGAGTGKTTIIIIKMFLEQNILRLTNDDILAITYTREGAQSMCKRYDFIRDEFSSSRFLDFRTIHSYCLSVCQAFLHEPKILTEFNDAVKYEWDEEENAYVEEKVKMVDLINEGISLLASQIGTKQVVTAKAVLGAINTIVEMCITSETEFRNQETYIDFPLNYNQIMSVYDYYNKKKKELDVFDYLDMLTKANEIFGGILDGSIKPANSYQEKMYTFKSIYIDEVQDISPLQVKIVDKLLKLNPEARLTVIGDADQSIYSFRGANVDYIMNFPEIYKDEKTLDVVYLTRNRRSAPNIISLSDKFIRNNKKRFPKNLRGLDNDSRVGNISIYEDSVGYIHKNIILNVLKTVKEKNIADLRKYAVLYREHKQATWLINYLVCNRIPFNINLEHYSEEFVVNAREFWDLIYLSHLIRQPNNADLVKLYLWKLVPAITKGQAEKISFEMKTNPNAKLLPYVRKYGTEEDVKDIIALRQLMMDKVSPAVFFKALAKRYRVSYYNHYIKTQRRVDKMSDILEYFEYKKDLASISVEIDSDRRWIRLNTHNTASVTLNTFHISKGLEYDNVFILPISDETTPKLRRVMRTMTAGGLVRYIEEERRLLYVAITRAKENLCIFFTPNIGVTDNQVQLQKKDSDKKRNNSFHTKNGMFATELLAAYEEVLKEYPEMRRQVYLTPINSATKSTSTEKGGNP